MEIKTVYAVYFSATGRTRKVVTTLANAIAQTLELPLETVDFTLPAAREETYAFTDKDLVIFGHADLRRQGAQQAPALCADRLYRKRRACRAGRDLRQPQL